MLARLCQPDGVKVCGDQVAVGQIERWRPYHAANHFFWVLKVMLIVRTLRRAVGDHQSSLPRTTCTAGALRIIGRSRRYITEINGIERRDVDTQFHRRGTEKDRKSGGRFP